jgi:subtilase family serine protease
MKSLSGCPLSRRRSSTHRPLTVARFELLEDRRLLSTSPVGFTPAQIRHAYGIDSISLGGVTGDGSGQTIAIITVGDNPKFVNSTSSGFSNSDLHKFDQQFGLADPPSFKKVTQTGGTSNFPAPVSGWAQEAALDVEWAHVTAPKANLLLVEANSGFFPDLIGGAVQFARQQAGVSVVSMSFGLGEDSSFGSQWDSTFTTPSGHGGVSFVAAAGDNGAPATYPATSPNVIGIGGTRLKLSPTDSTGITYDSETGWGMGGGGESSFEPRPSYQSSVGGGRTRRLAPDVSFVGDTNVGVAIYDSYNNPSSPWTALGGTSVGTPVWSGLIAIADQFRKANGLGSMDGRTQTLPSLYQLPSNDFHDITSGNNGFSAGVGYDLVTGLGSPKANLLVPDLAGVPSTTTGSISGNLYNDINGNMSRQSGEPNLSGRKFYIDSNKNGKLDSGEPTVFTDSNGNFKFSNLAAGTYRIREVMPSGWRASVPSGAAWSKDVIVAAGQTVTGVSFADTQKVFISGNVFNDINSSGTQTSGESGLSGWRVYIDLNNDGKFESNEPSTLTDSSGNYHFGTLSANTFRIRVVPPSGVTGYKTVAPSGGVYTITLASGGLAMNKVFAEHKA